MRKQYYGFLLLFLLSLAGLAASHSVLSVEARDVAMRETTLLGDASAAEGLTARVRMQHDYRLFWDTAFSLDGQAETDFRPSIQPDYPDTFFRDNSIHLSLDLHHGYEAMSGVIDYDNLSPLQLAVAQRVEEQIAPKATLQTSFPLEEFLDHYPTTFRLGSSGNWDTAFLRDLNDAFRFPLQKGEFLLVNAKAAVGGKLCKLDINTTLDQRISERCVYSNSDDLRYFVPEVRMEDGTLLDYSSTPNGYGIYTLPNGQEDLTIQELQFFSPLDESCSVMDLAVTEDQQSLLLVTGEPQPRLLRFDLASGKQLQALLLPSADRSSLFCDEAQVLVVQNGGSFQFFTEDPDGSYSLQLSGSAPRSGDWAFPLDNVCATDWDGQKLALLTTDWRETETTYEYPLMLLICDASGTLYAGELDSSLNRCQYLLDTGEENTWFRYCDYQESDPCDLAWN